MTTDEILVLRQRKHGINHQETGIPFAAMDALLISSQPQLAQHIRRD
jgi:hypothetical protein